MDSGHIELEETVRFRRVIDEGVVVDLRSGNVLIVNQLGVRVLELLGEKKSTETLLSTLNDEYEVTRDQLESDVSDYLHELNEHQLLVNS